jgi:hypothetical protein
MAPIAPNNKEFDFIVVGGNQDIMTSYQGEQPLTLFRGYRW